MGRAAGDGTARRGRPAWLAALLLTTGPLALGAAMGGGARCAEAQSASAQSASAQSASAQSAAARTAAMPSPPVGRWLSQDHDGVFDIRVCGETLCGRLVGMRYDGAMPLDSLGHPQCGLMMLTGFVREADDPSRWAGMILDPEHGRTYHATIWSPEPGRLNLHGYLLLPLFGRTERWTRYEGDIGQACHLPAHLPA